MSEESLFVYGTLRRGADSPWRRLLKQFAGFAGEATLRGKMYRVDFYPGAVCSGDPRDRIQGEVFRLIEPNIVLEKLDDYEACSEAFPDPKEFIRQKQKVCLRDGTVLEAWVYLYNRPIEGLETIETGDFLKTHFI